MNAAKPSSRMIFILTECRNGSTARYFHATSFKAAQRAGLVELRPEAGNGGVWQVWHTTAKGLKLLAA